MPWKCFSCIKSDTEDIVRLDYRHCSLSDVPPEVFAFERTLEELYLDANRIKDLPRPLFHCHGLRHLGLSDNEIQSIPAAISSLINLEHLDISKNAISGIPDSIKGCKVLTMVDASVNPLEKLPEGFMQLLALEELYLNDAYLEFLPANFGRLQKLRILELRENHLNTLPKSIARLVNLQRLDIGQNEFSDVPEVVGQLPNITELWCDFNRIRGIPQFVGNLKKLIHLDASNNNITWVASDIENCQKLSDLTLSGNEIQEIPGSIGNLKNLMTLKLDDNQLAVLPESIGRMAMLEELILSQNDFETLPPSIGLLRKLQILNVDENMLEDLPPEIGSCCNLRILSVAGNRLVQIPGEIGHLTNLKVANLSGNRLSNLPVSLLGLSSLAALWLSDNQAQPLVPLQPDVDPLTGQRVLTCFMLPQTCSVSAEVRTPPQVVVPGYIPVGDSDAEGDGRSEEERIRRRHIRFAADSELDVGGRLLRAPTPYPKELRALARHARSLQRVSHATNGPVPAPPPLCQGSFCPPHQQEGESGTPVVAEWIPSGIQENKIKEAKVTKAQTSPSVVNEVHDPGMEPVSKRSSDNDESPKVKEENSSVKMQPSESVDMSAEKDSDLKKMELKQNGTEDHSMHEAMSEFAEPDCKTDSVDISNDIIQSENGNDCRPSPLDYGKSPPAEVSNMSKNVPQNGNKEEQEENIKFLQNSATPPLQPPPYYIAAAYSKKAAFFNSDVQSRSSISSLPPFSVPGDRLTPLLETNDRARPCSVASSKYETSLAATNHSRSEQSWTNSSLTVPREEDPVKDDLEELSERVEASLNELGMTVEETPLKALLPQSERLTSLSSPSHITDSNKLTASLYPNVSGISSIQTSPSLDSPSDGREHPGEEDVILVNHEKRVPSVASRLSGDDYSNNCEPYIHGNSLKGSISEEDEHHIPCDSSPAVIPNVSPEVSPLSNSESLDIVSSSVTHDFMERKGSYVPDVVNDSPKTIMGGSRIPVSKTKIIPRSANEEIREMSLGKPPNFTQDKPSAGTHLIAPTPQRVNAMPAQNSNIDGTQDLATPMNNSHSSSNSPENTSISPSRIPSVSGIQSPKTTQSWQRTSPLPSFTSKMPSPGFSMAKKSSIPSPMYGSSRTGVISSPPTSPTVETSPSQQPRPAASTSPHSKIPQLAGATTQPAVGSNGKSPPPKGSDSVDKPQKIAVSSSKIPMPHSARSETSPVADGPNKSRIPVSPQSKPLKSWMFGLHKNAMVFPVSIHKNPGLGFSIAGGHHPNNSPDKQDSGIYITKIHPSGPASGSLIPGDKILEVDGIDFTKLEHDQAVSILTQTGNVVQMMISRQQ
ncbi:erbin [Hetaerina americana]|uniref:erbin n=1 Tax=Hetaerina americana TaxID=62018 RepID=UPI003A7F6027